MKNIKNLKNNMNLKELTTSEFVENYNVTENIVDIALNGEFYYNVEITWTVDDENNDHIILDGIYYTNQNNVDDLTIIL